MHFLETFRLAGSTAGRGLRRLVEPHLLFPLLGLVLLAVIWGTTLNLVEIERANAHRAAASSSKELVETYEAQVVRALREIDQSLKFVKYAHERQGGRLTLAELRDRGLLPADLLFSVSIANASGDIAATTRPGESSNVGDADYFIAQRRNDTFFIGRPRFSSVEREWKLQFSRRLNAADGSFAGVVIVSVGAAYFVSGYEQSKLGEQGMIGVLGSDGIFRARRTGELVSSGDTAPFSAIVPAAERSEPVVEANSWDGVRRYTSARQLFDFPLAVIVGLAEKEQFEGLDQHLRTYVSRATAGSILLVLFLILLGRMSGQLTANRLRANSALQEEIDVRRLAEVALRLRNRAIESSVNAILIIDFTRPDYPLEYVNAAFEKITGYTAAEAVGRNGNFLLGQDYNQPGVLDIKLALREQREGHAVVRNYRKDGSLFWNDFHIAPVKNENGQVTHYVGVMNDITEAKNYEEQLAHQANFDALTGLANRNLLNDRLSRAIVSAHRSGDAVVALFLDVDNFKLVNDSLGHNMGDELLTTLAARLKACVRESDTVARLGGDEFVVLLVNNARQENPFGAARKEVDRTSLESDVTVLMHKLLTNISLPVNLGHQEIRPTCSIGISIFPQDGENGETLLRNADAAMYRAKELGRNRFQFFTADVHERIRKRMELESSLRQALERDEFELHYQPQIGVKSGAVVGAEALLRWRHPQKGLIGPDQFIKFAEESGLIIPIGKWVLTQACTQNKAWQDAGLPPIPVSVNMSAKQCEQPDVTTVVKRALKSAGLAAQFLELEITESISMANPEQSVPLMASLKETGVALSIDDFGTGFSNMSYLKRFPVDRLKIDLSFVREITSDPGSLAIAAAIITMSHSLNLQVVAEGVETEGQLALLKARGCDLVQGYYFSRPLSADDFAAYLKAERHIAPEGAGHANAAAALLVLDDDPDVLAMLKWQLQAESYPLLLTATVAEAFEMLARNEVGIVLCDQHMPGSTGVDFLTKVRSMYPDTVRILFSGQDDFAATAQAIKKAGIYKFMRKSWERDELKLMLDEAFHIYRKAAGATREMQNDRVRAFRPN